MSEEEKKELPQTIKVTDATLIAAGEFCYGAPDLISHLVREVGRNREVLNNRMIAIGQELGYPDNTQMTYSYLTKEITFFIPERPIEAPELFQKEGGDNVDNETK